MHTLSLIYAAAHWLSSPGVWFVKQAFGGDKIDLTEWTSEGVQLHPDILMYAGAVLGTWEWVNYLLNQTELTTVESITSIQQPGDQPTTRRTELRHGAFCFLRIFLCGVSWMGCPPLSSAKGRSFFWASGWA
jgi:hypothetical protein